MDFDIRALTSVCDAARLLERLRLDFRKCRSQSSKASLSLFFRGGMYAATYTFTYHNACQSCQSGMWLQHTRLHTDSGGDLLILSRDVSATHVCPSSLEMSLACGSYLYKHKDITELVSRDGCMICSVRREQELVALRIRSAAAEQEL